MEKDLKHNIKIRLKNVNITNNEPLGRLTSITRSSDLNCVLMLFI